MHAYRASAAVLVFLLGAVGSALLPAPALAQTEIPIKVTVTVGGRTETLRGNGNCGHEPRAWLDGKAAALWLARYGTDDEPVVSLSYWRPGAAGAAEQFSFMVQRGEKEHRISTVGRKKLGSGRTTFRPTAQGGRFEIVGKDQNGAPLQATIECARFTGINAVGG